MSVESFKNFVKDKPNLIKYVESGKKSWQDFYNIYELYGDKKEIWDKYLTDTIGVTTGIASSVTLKDLFNQFKNIDVTSFRDSINSLQKGINYISDLAKEKESISKRNVPLKRPMYKFFDD